MSESQTYETRDDGEREADTHYHGFEDQDDRYGLPPGSIDDTLNEMYPDGNPDLEDE